MKDSLNVLTGKYLLCEFLPNLSGDEAYQLAEMLLGYHLYCEAQQEKQRPTNHWLDKADHE